jgi:hypothetical protein
MHSVQSEDAVEIAPPTARETCQLIVDSLLNGRKGHRGPARCRHLTAEQLQCVVEQAYARGVASVKTPHTVYVAGEFLTEGKPDWGVVGVFTEEKLAVEACHTPLHFVGPMPLNDAAGADKLTWPGYYFPVKR